MWSSRSGALSRFLVFRSPAFWAPRGELVVFNGIFGFAPLVAAIVGFGGNGLAALQRVADRHDSLHHLARPVDAEEARRGVVRVAGTLRGGRVCTVTLEQWNGKSYDERWSGVLGDARVELDAGAPPLAIRWTDARWWPAPSTSVTKRDAEIRAAAKAAGYGAIPAAGRFVERCVGADEPVFVEGCARTADGAPRPAVGPTAPALLERCDDGPLVITPGVRDAHPRVAVLAARLAGRASMLALAALLVLMCLWRLSGARPFADALVRKLPWPRLPIVEPLAVLFVPFLVPGLWLLGLHVVPRLGGAQFLVERHGYAGACFSGIACLILASRMLDRHRALGAVAAMVRAGRSRPLDRVREGEAVALDATVDPDAPCTEAPVARAARAHWLVTVTRCFKNGRNYDATPSGEQHGSMLVPVRSKRGVAFVDLTQTTVDLRAKRLRVSGGRLRDHLARLVDGGPDAASIYVFEERFLDPKEPLHVIGRVRRFQAGSSGSIPVIGGAPGDLAVVHAGSRRSLLRALAIERGYLAFAIAVCFGMTAAIAALSAYLASR
ncbi:Hypothetical protein A7982_06279 [Minicystis rosea]|nr:Hypothetical protein A7982_06279 [Minicystis rosea]